MSAADAKSRETARMCRMMTFGRDRTEGYLIDIVPSADCVSRCFHFFRCHAAPSVARFNSALTLSCCSIEAHKRRRFIRINSKNGAELCKQHQIQCFLAQLHQLDRTTLSGGFVIARNQLAEAKAVEVGHAAKIENDILARAAEQSANGVSKGWSGSS